jgi:hypothetical protein
LPHSPQWFTSLVASTQLPPQRTNGASHAKLHVFALHDGVACGGALHAAPQPPQLCGSFIKITHSPPQLVSPSPHRRADEPSARTQRLLSGSQA